MFESSIPLSHQCLVRKKPSPLAARPWCTVEKRLQQRFLVTRGRHVDYFAHPRTGKARPKGYFDLRNVTLLRPAREGDPTAPEFAVEIRFGKHHIFLDFQFCEQFDVCLHIWLGAVPIPALSHSWANGASAAVRRTLLTIPQSLHHTELQDDDDDDAAGGGDAVITAEEPALCTHDCDERCVFHGPLKMLAPEEGRWVESRRVQ